MSIDYVDVANDVIDLQII